MKCWFLCHVWLFAIPWTVDHQVPLSMGFSRQEYWSGLPCSSPGDFPDPGIEPHCRRILYCLSHQGSSQDIPKDDFKKISSQYIFTMVDEAENNDETMHWSGKIQGSLKEWLMPGTEEEIQDEFGTFCCARSKKAIKDNELPTRQCTFPHRNSI